MEDIGFVKAKIGSFFGGLKSKKDVQMEEHRGEMSKKQRYLQKNIYIYEKLVDIVNVLW